MTTVLMLKWQPDVVCTFLASGCDVHLVVDDYDHGVEQPDPHILGKCAAVYRVSSFDALEEVAAVAADLLLDDVRPDVVFAHTEFTQIAAGYLRSVVGEGASDGVVRAGGRELGLRDKRIMKRLVGEAGVRVTRWCSLRDLADDAEVERVAAELHFPVVVKPAFGFGTMNTHRADDPDQFRALLADYGYEPLIRARQLIVEEFVEGRELHIDALWANGEPCYFHVSAYPATRLTLADEVKAIDDGTIEDTGILDGSLILSAAEHPDLYDRALAMQRAVNEALDIRHGPTHMEVFESASGTLTFSEIAARMGGGWVPAIQSAYVGENVWKLTGRALTEGGIPSRSRPTGHIGALNLRPTHSGRIVAMPDEERLLAEDGVLDYVKIRNVGETISLRTGTYWCAYVVLRADTEEEFMERARHLLARHKVVTAAD